MAAAIFGLIGVIVGGLLTTAGSLYVQRREDLSARRSAARLTYDDYLHFQSTLVRALAAESWWERSAELAAQTTVGDRKQLLGMLDDDPSQDVAAAQGWMDYLIHLRQDARPHEQPSENELMMMRDTFCRLDRGRWQLSGDVSGRRYRTFADGAVLSTLEHPTTLEALGISEADCDRRRAENYGRIGQAA